MRSTMVTITMIHSFAYVPTLPVAQATNIVPRQNMMDEIWKLVQARDQLQAQGTRQANFIAELSRSFTEQTQALGELRIQHASQRNIIAKQAQAIEELRAQCSQQQREPPEAIKTADGAKVYNMIPGLPTRFPPAPDRTSAARDS